MRRYAIALAGAATTALFAAQVPAKAWEGSFFLEQHQSYFERPGAPGARPASPVVLPSAGTRSVALATPTEPGPEADASQEPVFGSGHAVYGGQPAIEGRPLVSRIPREMVAYDGPYTPGMIVISTEERRLYYVLPDHQAIRYGVGVGRPGFEWSGVKTIVAKKEWPEWTPPPEMIKRRPDLPRHMVGGIGNPLGARAMYLGGTMYRIHGSNEPDSIGQAVSSGCIRMTNDDVADLYERVKVGTRAVVAR